MKYIGNLSTIFWIFWSPKTVLKIVEGKVNKQNKLNFQIISYSPWEISMLRTRIRYNQSIVFPGGSVGKGSTCNAGNPGLTREWGRSPGEGMATHSSILVWKIPWTEESGELQCILLQRVRHNWVSEHIYIYSFQSWKFSLTSVLGETPKELWGRKWPPFSHPDWWITSWYPGVTDFKVEGGYCKKKKICYKGNQLFLTYRMWTVEGTTDALKSNSLTLQMRKLRLRRGTHPPWIQD